MYFTVKQKIMAFGKQYRAFDGAGNQVYEIRSMILTPERRKEVYDMGGALVAWSEWPVMSGQAVMECGGARVSFEVPFMSIAPEWTGTDGSGNSFSVTGNFFRRSFTVSVGGSQVATIESLLPSAGENLTTWLGAGLPAWAQESMEELVPRGEWAELNDRFYRYLEFGTGGMRGRTIGRVGAKAETGTPDAKGSPAHAGIGSNMLNDFTLVRATVGLYRYVAKYLAGRNASAKPRIAVAAIPDAGLGAAINDRLARAAV